MKTISKALIAIVVALLLSHTYSCNEQAIKTETTQVNGIKLELLFEKDGCKVYRFLDGRYIYWSDCRGRMEHNYRSGKTNYKQQTIND